MRFQESSPVPSTPDQDIITITKAAAGKSGQLRKGKRILLSIEDIFGGCSGGAWSCACGYVEIQGGSLLVYDGPKWRICEFSMANETYDRFKERIKVVVFVSDYSIRFKISYTQVNFSVSGK